MKKNLVIVEFKDEVDFILKHQPELFNQKAVVLSLLPEASAALKREGIAFETSLKVFSKQSHEKCLIAVDEMINRVGEVIAIEDDNGIEQAYNNTFTFYLRAYISYVVFIIEVFDRFIDQQEIESIFAFDYTNNDYTQINLGSQERIAGAIALAFENKVKVNLFKRKMDTRCHRKRGRLFLKSVLAMILNKFELMRLGAIKKPSVLFYSLQYNFDTIAKNLKGFQYFNLIPREKEFLKLREKREGFEVNHLHLNDLRRRDKRFTTSFNDSLSKISETHFRERIFLFNDVDFSKIVLNKLRVGFDQILSDIHRKSSSINSIISKLKPSVVVSAMSRELSFALGEFAKREKIPSLLISHGSHVPPKNQYDRREWLDHGKGLIDTDYQYHLLQSPWARAYADQMSEQKNYHNIFPVIFNKVDRTQKNAKQLEMYPLSRGKKIIVHASTPKSRRATRLYVYETMDEYIENIKDLIDATKNNPDVFLIIRYRPSSDLSTESLVELLPKSDHYVVATEGDFSDYLTIADLLVSFSSTTIEEALYNKIPVLEYDRTGRYTHIEGSLWKNGEFEKVHSVYWLGDKDILAQAIQWINVQHLSQEKGEEIFTGHFFNEEEAEKCEDFIGELVGR